VKFKRGFVAGQRASTARSLPAGGFPGQYTRQCGQLDDDYENDHVFHMQEQGPCMRTLCGVFKSPADSSVDVDSTTLVEVDSLAEEWRADLQIVHGENILVKCNAGYRRSDAESSFDSPDLTDVIIATCDAGKFIYYGSLSNSPPTCVSVGSINSSVGGMNGSEGSDNMNGSSCENIAGWVDSQNRTCEAYEEDGWLCETAVFDADAENISAVEACCSCGGSFFYTPAPLSASFFDASIVRYPSSYSYAATYETRSLMPAPGYAVGMATFSIHDISATESLDKKYAGGVLGPDGIVYFVPYDADKIGLLNLATRNFTTIDIAATISGLKKYVGGVLGPDGIVYLVPYDADKIGVLNPATQTFTTSDISVTISGGGKYLGGVLGPCR
jgi:hypothetical protein